MNFIKLHWKEILLVLFIVFSLNKCTVACNRDSKIKKQQIELVKKDSIINAQVDSLNIMNVRWNDAQTSQSTYRGIALGNQQELLNQIEDLKSKNNILEKRVDMLLNNNAVLKSENIKLRQSIKK